MRLDWAIENLNFFARTRTLILTGLEDGLTVQPLSGLEPIEDDSWQTLKHMGGQILGYNKDVSGFEEIILVAQMKKEIIEFFYACLTY